MTTRAQPHRHWLAFGFSLVLTALALYFVFRKVDANAFHLLITKQDRGLLAAAFIFVLLQIFLAAERWRAILGALMRGKPPPVVRVQAVFYASIFFNCLPLGTIAGDVARVLLARKFALSVRRILLSVMLDRVLTVGTLIMLCLVTLPTIAGSLATTAWFGAAVLFVIGAAGFLLLQPIERMLGRWRDLRLLYLVLRTMEELRHLARHHGLIALIWALLSSTSGALAAYCIARSIGLDVGLIAMIAVMSIVTFVAALPISLAGWGLREVSAVALLSLLGVARDGALLLSVEFGLLSTLASLPGGLIWLTLREHGGVALSDP